MEKSVSAPPAGLPARIFTGHWQGGHIQGIALDRQRRHLYCSFTTELVKLDLQGNLIGTVEGLTGHLGCLCLGPDGRIYGSLEYKNDAIGQGILKRKGIDARHPDAFYIAVFDGERITRPHMDAARDGVMTAVCLPEVAEDYAFPGHRYGCSGIDGLSFGPDFGQPDGAPLLCVACGIYGDTGRADNDHQVLLQYDTRDWSRLEGPLSPDTLRREGAACRKRYFVRTGNTTYGVQNLEYDPFLNRWLMAVYPGKKPQFPNRPLYMIDGSVPPVRTALQGLPEEGELLSLCGGGLPHPSGIEGWDFPWGSTGIAALGDGYYYFSEDRREDAGYCSDIRLYRWCGEPERAFVRV